MAPARQAAAVREDQSFGTRIKAHKRTSEGTMEKHIWPHMLEHAILTDIKRTGKEH